MVRWGLILLAIVCAQALQAQDLQRVMADVAVLTSDSLHGRGYVNDGSNKAAAYLAGRFRQIGLEPLGTDYFQAFTFPVNVYSKPSSLRVNGQVLREGHDYIADPNSGISSGKFKVQHFDSTHFQTATMPSLKKGRAPVVHMQGIDTPDEVSALHTFKIHTLEQVPVLQVSPHKLTWGVGQRRYQHAVLEVGAASFPERVKQVQLEVQPEVVEYQAVNLIGKIAGTRSDSCLVITAHYDHLGRMGEALFTGASDNASGTAAMLDLAAFFTAHKPPMDIYFIAFAAEEAGLIGSKHFVDNPLIPLESIRFLVNLDLMGSASKGITIVNGKLYDAEISRIGSINKEHGYVPKIKLRGKAANSDHYWFSEAGVPAIFIYTEGDITAYHDVHDVAAGLNWANYEGLFTLLRTFIETF